MYQDFINNVILKYTASVIYSALLTSRQSTFKATSVAKAAAALAS